MKKVLIICLLIFGLLTLTACNHKGQDGTNDKAITGAENTVNTAGNNDVQKISDIQKPENVGKTVTVSGKVVNTMQSATYHISGYKIQDSTGAMIDVSSTKIPQINSTVTVKGTLIQTRFFGLVINETG